MMNGAYGAYNAGIGGAAGCGGSGVFGLHLSTLLFVGIAVFAVYLFFKNRNKPVRKDPQFAAGHSTVIDAAEIARLRYARGDISFDEFQTILKSIQS